MAHFAFLDSIWFGEGFSPSYPPDQWFVEMSGIPFGIHAEQVRIQILSIAALKRTLPLLRDLWFPLPEASCCG
jgi:hypothetical protein